jgi:hypothetical protein
MLIVMSPGASEHDVVRVVQTIVDIGHEAAYASRERLAVGVIGDPATAYCAASNFCPRCSTYGPTSPHKRASRELCSVPTAIELENGTRIGTAVWSSCGPLFGGVPEPDPRSGAQASRRRYERASRWRIQATPFTLRISGAESQRTGAARGSRW